jgi:hypothetical protein
MVLVTATAVKVAAKTPPKRVAITHSRLWINRLEHQMHLLPPFTEVSREGLRAVRAGALPTAEA